MKKSYGGLAILALVALAIGFLLAGQLKAQLLTPSNLVARSEALVRSVQDLEKTNETDRTKIASLRSEIAALEADAASRSAATRALKDQVSTLRAHAGLVPLRGPGLEVDLRNGRQGQIAQGTTGYLVNFEDVQDVVNLLYASGAEAVSVGGRRITPLSAFSGSEGEVVIDQGPPLTAPIKILAVGDRNAMEAAFSDPAAAPDLRSRAVRYGIQVNFNGLPDLTVPAYDSSLRIPYVHPA